MKKNNLILTAMLAIALCFAACGGSDVDVTTILLDKTTLSLAVGDEYTLLATVVPNNATNKKVSWASSNPAVASVAGGKITALSAGTTTIVANIGDKLASCEVIVERKGVLINGVEWAKTNIDKPNTFATNPESYGMFYQWGRKTAWSENDPLKDSNGGTMWNTTHYEGTTWTAENDPSPAGWRLPTKEELQSLLDQTKVTSVWTTQNGVNGRKFTDKTTGANIFLPAAGWRSFSNGTLVNRGSNGFYWSSTVNNASYAYYMSIDSTAQYTDTTIKSYGFSVRCVAK